MVDPHVPRELQEAVLPHVQRWGPMYLPFWVHDLILGWQKEHDGSDVTTTTVLEYRWARIALRPSFLSCTWAERSEEVLHEILHVSLAPVLHPYADLVDFVQEKYPDVARWAKQKRLEGMEAVIVDLSHSIFKTFGAGSEPGVLEAELARTPPAR